MRLLTGVVV